MYRNVPYPKFLARNKTPADLEPTLTWNDGGSVVVSRSDTIRRKKPKRLDTTNVVTTVQDLRHALITDYAVAPGYIYQGSTANLGVLGRPDSGDAYARAAIIAQNRLRAQARSNGVNLGMMLGEYRQAAKLFSELSSQAVGFYRKVRRGNWHGAFDTYKRSKDFLQFQYGIRPLMSDMHEAMSELRQAKLPKPWVGSSASLRGSFDKKNVFGRTPYPSSHFWEIRVKCRAQVRYVENFYFDTLTRHGLTNVAALAYELTPFSFVLDWWVNVGEVLESLDNSLIFSGLDGFISTKIYEVVTVGNGHYIYKESRRNTASFSTTAQITYKPSVSLTHVLNGLALWRTIRN